ncbi:MAG: alanine--tRNA ligase [Patescibacteria group bacterium]|nr:alanine--tRNA ligase [Patescibacteria group bacterium]
MQFLTAHQIQEKFLKFFESKNHLIIKSHSLIPPKDDKSSLFVTSGMHSLKKLFIGQEKSKANRLCNVQKCLRTIDIDGIGDTYHNTFFFMLGNWSIGDYWKKEAIAFAWEFLTQELGLSKDNLYPTYFESDMPDVPTDIEMHKIWLNYLRPHQITGLGKEDNFWSAGPTGPCGPSSEIYYDLGKNKDWCGKCEKPGCSKCGRFLEIWNCAVCMQYNRLENGDLEPLPFTSIDAGAGLERITSVIQGKDNNYDTDLFRPIMDEIAHLTGKNEQENLNSFRIIADHIRAACFLIADGIRPGNLDREYVLRRVLRKLIRKQSLLEAKDDFLTKLADKVIGLYEEWWPEINGNKQMVIDVISAEQEIFAKALERGIKEFHKTVEKIKKSDHPHRNYLTGEEAFYLYETYGIPREIIEEIGLEIGFMSVPTLDFQNAVASHQQKSRESMAGKFKGGLSEEGDVWKKTQFHTTAHLMLEAMRRVLGSHVQQKGQNITDERIRFDFSHPDKLTSIEIEKIENLVNEQIKKDLPVSIAEMSVEEAKKQGAIGVFEDRYGDKIKVYSIGDFSKEICGGPHVERAGQIKGTFKILKEESSSKGVRRVKAIFKSRQFVDT